MDIYEDIHLNKINNNTDIDFNAYVDTLNYEIYNKFTLNSNNELNKNDPDYHIETFWYGLKTSMINFYSQNDLNYIHIYDWSNCLNKLKQEKKYDQIQFSIRDYISIYSKDIITNSNDNSHYDDDILITNIKRWNRISLFYNFEKNVKYNKLLILFLIILEIKKSKTNIDENIKFINNITKKYNIDTIINNNIYDDFILYALNHNRCKILELLKSIHNYNLYDRILLLFPKIKIYKKNITILTKMNKICKIYKKIYD